MQFVKSDRRSDREVTNFQAIDSYHSFVCVLIGTKTISCFFLHISDHQVSLQRLITNMQVAGSYILPKHEHRWERNEKVSGLVNRLIEH